MNSYFCFAKRTFHYNIATTNNIFTRLIGVSDLFFTDDNYIDNNINTSDNIVFYIYKDTSII